MDYTIQKGKTIILKSAKRVKQISIENILYISSDSYLLTIHFINRNKTEVFSKPLKAIEKELGHLHFVRINRNELINMKYFKSYYNNGSRMITLYNGKELIASRRKWASIKNYF